MLISTCLGLLFFNEDHKRQFNYFFLKIISFFKKILYILIYDNYVNIFFSLFYGHLINLYKIDLRVNKIILFSREKLVKKMNKINFYTI